MFLSQASKLKYYIQIIKSFFMLFIVWFWLQMSNNISIFYLRNYFVTKWLLFLSNSSSCFFPTVHKTERENLCVIRGLNVFYSFVSYLSYLLLHCHDLASNIKLNKHKAWRKSLWNAYNETVRELSEILFLNDAQAQ